MHKFPALVLAVLVGMVLASCGRESGSRTQASQEQNGVAPGAASSPASCPLSFPNAGLCGQIQWVVGPTADEASSFKLTFWNKDTGSAAGPFTEPSAQVGSYIRMTCCGSISFPTVNKVSDGNYTVSKVRFVPGSWEVFVQLKNGTAIEKQFIPVKLDE
jgi:hypothetical protein